MTNSKGEPNKLQGGNYLPWKPRRIRVGKPASYCRFTEQQQWPENHTKLWMLDCVKRHHLYFIIFNYELWLEFFTIFSCTKMKKWISLPSTWIRVRNEEKMSYFLTHCHKSLSEMFSIIAKSSVYSALHLLIKVLTATFNTFPFFILNFNNLIPSENL